MCAEDDTSVSEGDGTSYSDGDFKAVSDGSADMGDDAEHPPLHGDAERCSNIWLDFWPDFLLVMGFGTQVFGSLCVLFFAERDRKNSKPFHGLQGLGLLGCWPRELCICHRCFGSHWCRALHLHLQATPTSEYQCWLQGTGRHP